MGGGGMSKVIRQRKQVVTDHIVNIKTTSITWNCKQPSLLYSAFVQHYITALDNTVAVAYLSNMGGKSHLLHELTRKIWLWCIVRNIWLTVNHVPGAKNVIADELSRQLSMDTEWSLDYHVFHEICSKFGKPNVDLFASRLNNKLPKYVSFLPDPTACAIDAFNMNLDGNILYYSFPPFSCIGRLLQKMEIDRGEMILVAPLWNTQHWFTKMLKLLVADPIILPPTQQILSFPMEPEKTHPLKKMRLCACRLSGKLSNNVEYHKNLPKSSSLHGDPQPNNNIGCISKNGCVFVMEGRLITFTHL